MYTEQLIKILNKRGIVGEKEIEEFLSPAPKKTYPSSMLTDLDESVGFILSEIDSGSKICIYGDYDADGITSTTLMVSLLSNLLPKERLGYYIPSRFEEGYGLNKEALKTIKSRGFDLVITVDCGSVSVDEAAFAKETGIKIIVTDHHSISDKMVDCLLVNPKRPDSKYPFLGLSGCGVAFKLAQTIQQRSGLPKSVLTSVLDLVAIGTIGDIMPLVDENRTLCKYGLRELNKGKRYGLRRLAEETGLKMGTITSENISFVIAPHLNASGRIENASLAVKLLLAEEGDNNVDEMVASIISNNQERRRLQQQTFEKCLKLVGEAPEDFIVLDVEDAHEGITGIVAGKIKDYFNRPTIIVTPSGDSGEFLKGTGRSVEGVNLYDNLKKNQALFERFGGHAGACGFLMKKENFCTLRNNLIGQIEEIRKETPDVFDKKYDIDLTMNPADISIDLSEEIQLLAPFGNENPKPLVDFRNVEVNDVQFMGKDKTHVKFFTKNSSLERIQWVLFGRAQEQRELFLSGTKVNVLGNLDINVWQGRQNMQVMIKNIEKA